MVRLLQVAQLGHPVLRRKAKPVGNIKSRLVQELIDDLIATVMDVDGVGMAAPKAYQSLQIFILASHPNTRYPDAPEMPPTPVINPKIISKNRQKKKDWEGCLSIPGIRALIPRYTKIKVEFMNRYGKKETKEFTDFIARIFQHEYDHLQGLVFLDRVTDTKEIFTEKEYQKIITPKKLKKQPTNH